MHDNAPILIASAQKTYREVSAERTPTDALEEVVKLAIADSGNSDLADAIDSIATVRFVSDALEATATIMPRNPGNTVASRLGINAQCYQSTIGGNTPQQLVNTFADKLAKGEHQCTLIGGVELIASLFGSWREGKDIAHWAQEEPGDVVKLGQEVKGTSATEEAHGLFEPTAAYALVESAIRHAKGNSISEHQQQMADFSSAMRTVSSNNPHAWRQQELSPEEFISTDNGNRYIGFPYTKAMNAILAVDMAAAVIMTTVGKARQLGIDESQWIYLRGASDASEVWHMSDRTELHTSPAIKTVANAALQQAQLTTADMNYFDIYSCFPSAVQVACDAIGISTNDPRGITLTGGLYNFGGPGNNYSLHAIAEMAQHLRGNEVKHGLLTANGYYLTKHSVGVYSNQAPAQPWQATDNNKLQQALDAAAHPTTTETPQGNAKIIAYTVAYQKTDPVRGILIGELDNGERFVANTKSDAETFARMIAEDLVGIEGEVKQENGLNIFHF
jgi:acetyl-CoA C-acetyltransferase